jgi:hypothetical protein
MMTAEVAKEEVTREYVLKIADRCDQCAAQALVLVKLVTGELMFCGHHYKLNEKALNTVAFQIIDERDKLIENRAKGQSY